MANDHLAFRRRNIYERKAIRFVRGEVIEAGQNPATDGGNGTDMDTDMDSATLARYRQGHFGCLRQFSWRNGLDIRPLDVPYVAPGELAVLRWLAEAQRQDGLHSCHIRDVGLTTSLRHCARILKALGVCLPRQTLYIKLELDGCCPTIDPVGCHHDARAMNGRRVAPGRACWTSNLRTAREYPPS